MTDERIPPALSEEEWREMELSARGRTEPSLRAYVNSGGEFEIMGAWVNPDERHALAALCLYQQPFGFSQDDVLFLQQVANADLAHNRPVRAEHFLAIAARIAALLPPEGP